MHAYVPHAPNDLFHQLNACVTSRQDDLYCYEIQSDFVWIPTAGFSAPYSGHGPGYGKTFRRYTTMIADGAKCQVVLVYTALSAQAVPSATLTRKAKLTGRK